MLIFLFGLCGAILAGVIARRSVEARGLGELLHQA